MQNLFKISGLNIYLQIFFTLLFWSGHILLSKNKAKKESSIELLCIYTIGLAGWFSISSGLFGHILYADQVATSIGWPTQSGFQMELGFAAIGIGIVGFLGFWSKSFWLPFIISKSTFMIGAGATHIIHMIRYDNFSPSNVGIVVNWDFLFPLFLITIYILYRKENTKL